MTDITSNELSYPRYTPEWWEDICNKVMEGRTLTTIAAREDMPSLSLMYKYMHDNPTEKTRYELALQYKAYTYCDQIEAAAEEASDFTTDHRRASIIKTQIDALKWLSGVANPSKMGNNGTLKHVGDPDNPIEHKHALDEQSKEALQHYMEKHANGGTIGATDNVTDAEYEEMSKDDFSDIA